jgi:hypothetical protein
MPGNSTRQSDGLVDGKWDPWGIRHRFSMRASRFDPSLRTARLAATRGH